MFLFAFLRRGFGGRNRLTPDVVPPTPDPNTRPTQPTALTATSTLTTSVTFSWTGSTTTDALTLLGYKVYIGADLYGVTNASTTTIQVTDLTPSTAYSFTVKSYTSALDSLASDPLPLTTLADLTPDTFAFAQQSGVAINTAIPSNVETITGITAPVVVSVNSGEYQIDGGGYTSTAGAISNGQTLQLRITSSPAPFALVLQKVTVGATVRNFAVITGAGDSVPDDFTFTVQDDVTQDIEIEFGPVTITGIDVAVPVSVSGDGNPTWQKNGTGPFTSAPGTVVVNDTIIVHHQSSILFNTGTNSTLTVGGVPGIFTSITIQGGGDDISPTPFTIPYQFGVPRNAVWEYGPVTIGSINVPVTVGVGGNGNPAWSKDGITWFTAPGTISVGENFYIRATSSNLYYTPVIAYGTIGTLVVQYTLVTTDNVDSDPDPFQFATQTEAAKSTLLTSDVQTITGIDFAVAVSVTNGTWRKNETGPYSALPLNVNPGETVEVQHTSAATDNTPTVTTLNVGLGQGTFTSRTVVGANPDNTPDAIADQLATGIAVGTTNTFTPVTVTGIDSTVSASISGPGNPQFDIAGGGYVTSGTVALNEDITVQVDAPATYGSSNVAALDVGTITVLFTVTTPAADITPDAFAFVDQTGVAVNTQITSAAVPILGINTPASTSVVGGEWRVTTGTFSTAPGSVSPGESVQARHTSSGASNTQTDTTLTVGGVTDTFTSTTLVDTEAPSAPILTATLSGNDTALLSWFASNDNVGVLGYVAYVGAGAGSYTTAFNLTENPISEGGTWSNSGVDWTDVVTNGDLAYGTHTGGAAESYALLSGFTADQSIEATVVKDAAITNYQEAQLHLRWTDSASSATGYSIGLEAENRGALIFRWDGGLGSTTQLATSLVWPRIPVTGDVIKATIVGNLISVYFNDVLAGTATDPMWATGNPGIGFYSEDGTGSQNSHFGFTSITATDLSGGGPVEFYRDSFLSTSQTDIPPSTTRTYTVKAFDAADNYSPASLPKQVTTPPPVQSYNRTLTGINSTNEPGEQCAVSAPMTGGYIASGTTISGVSGTISDGSTITITGSEFGVGNGTPLLWEDFEAGTPAANLNASPTIGTWSLTGANYTAATYSTTNPYSGSQCGQSSLAGNNSTNFNVDTGGSRDLMVSFRYRFDFSSSPTAGLLNMLIVNGATSLGSGSFGRIFFDDFESGNTNQWDTDSGHNRAQVVTSSTDGVAGPHSGTYMVRGNWNGTVAPGNPADIETLRLRTFNYTSELFIRIWMRSDENLSRTGNSSAKTMRAYESSIMDYYHEFKGGAGLFFDADINGFHPDTYWGGAPGDNTASTASWHKFETYSNTATGKLKAWHDGVLIQDATASYGGQRYTNLYLLSNFADTHDATNHVYFDDIEVFSDNGTGGTGSMLNATATVGVLPTVHAYGDYAAGNTWRSGYVTDTGATTEVVWPTSSMTDENVWHRVDFWGRQSSAGGVADGSVTIVVDSVPVFNQSNIITRNSLSNSWDSVDFMQEFTGINQSSTNAVDCCYMNNTWARVLVSDSPTYSPTMHSEIQPASAWAGGEITCNLNLGSFTDFSALYLYVVDSNGVANTNGWDLVP